MVYFLFIHFFFLAVDEDTTEIQNVEVKPDSEQIHVSQGSQGDQELQLNNQSVTNDIYLGNLNIFKFKLIRIQLSR